MKIKFQICQWLLLSALFALSLCGCEKDRLDKQMAELCKKDGGSKVYETVALPADMFDESGYPFPGWRDRQDKEDRLSKDYFYVREEIILKAGDPLKGEGQLSRFHTKIIRRSDSKLLGEKIFYTRTGGDGIVIGHFTMNTCPKTDEPIDKLIFIKR